MNIPQERLYPLKIPRDEYEPPVQRWALKLPEDIQELRTVYIGIQQHNSTADTLTAAAAAAQTIEEWLGTNGNSSLHPSFLSEALEVVSGYDQPGSRVWVVYYTSAAACTAHTGQLQLPHLYGNLGRQRASIGLWREFFGTPVAQLETNYSGNDYTPGLSRIWGSSQQPHRYSAYWGAARDRIPASAYDKFQRSCDDKEQKDDTDSDTSITAASGTLLGLVETPQSLGKLLTGAIGFDNIVHIRSGQFWERCGQEERDAYENDLEPALREGLAHLHDHPFETGNLGLRFLRNVKPVSQDIIQGQLENNEEHPRRETSAAGFFRNLDDLEQWTKRHKSHLAIYNGAHRHAKRFAGKYLMRTWHEVSILKRGQAEFEYVNCVQGTGAIQFLKLQTHNLP